MILVGIRTAVLAILLVCCHHPVKGRGPYDLAFVVNRSPPGVYSAQTDTFNFTIIPGTSSDPDSRPLAVDYDPVDEKVYWTDTALFSIQRSFLDGSGKEVLITDANKPDGLTLDLDNRVMYWTDATSDLIEKATMDGLNRKVVVNLTDSSGDDQVKPRAIILDTNNRYLFWTDWGALPMIERANTDGSDRTVLVDTDLVWPNGLALDSQGARLYWCDGKTGRIESSDLYGRDRGIIAEFSQDIHQLFYIAVYDGFVYWTDFVHGTGLVGSNLQFINPLSYGTHTFVNPGGLHIYEVPEVCEAFSCLNGGNCVDLLSGFYCSCLPGYSGYRCEIGQCVLNITHDSTLNRTIQWLPTVAGQSAESFERCSLNTTNAGEPIASRDCLVVDPPTYFEWEPDYMLLDCGDAVKPTVEDVADRINVTKGNAEEVAIFIANQTSKEGVVEIEDVATILMKIAGAGSGNPKVTNAVVETVNNIIIENQNTNNDLASDNGVSSSSIVQSVEAQISSTLQQEGMISIQQPTLHIEGVSLDPMQTNGGFSFVSLQQPGSSQESGSLEGTEVRTFNSTSEIPQDIEVVASVQLPQNILDVVQSLTGDNSSQLQASFIVYAGDDLFQSSLIRGSNSSIKVTGPVVSLTVEGIDLVNLTEPLGIELQVLDNATLYDNTSFSCVFWDFTKADGVGDWSTAGCVLARQTDNTVSCNCSHATNFAILVDVKGQNKTDDPFAQALDIISQIGIVLSIIALSATLIIYLSIKKLRSGKSRQIFIHFCVSLLLLYIVFIAGIDSARGKGGACTFVAALIHYLALTTMMWMAVEARNMYVSTVKVFPEDTSRYMLKACLVAWGSPLIIVIITLASASSFYGSEHNCFIRPGLAMHLGLLVPIAIILLHNIITFILVMRSLLKIREVSRSQQISKRLQNAIGISALMGLTWVFGFLAIGGATFAFQLIFCLANSLQGVVVCIMFCIRREEVRTAMAPYCRRICCGRTCHLFGDEKTYEVETVHSSGPKSPSSVSNTVQLSTLSVPE